MAGVAERQRALERRLLAYMYSDKRFIAEAGTKLAPSQLRSTPAQRIYALLVGYFNRFNGVLTDPVLEDQLRRRSVSADELIELRNLRAEIRRETLADEAEFQYTVDQLLDAHRRRLILGIANDIAGVGPNGCSPADLEKLQERITHALVAAQTTGGDEGREGELAADADERLEAYEYRKAHPDEAGIIKTGFAAFDDKNGGVRRGELLYVLGRKGAGKSVMLAQLAINMWLQGLNVIMYSLEISKEDYQRRLDANAANVDVGGLKLGKLTEEDEAKYRRYIEGLKKGLAPDGRRVGKLHVVDITAPTPAVLRQHTDRQERLLGVRFDAVFVDYSQLMKSNVAYDQKRHELTAISLDLKNWAKDEHRFIASAAQMNRTGRAEGQRGDLDTAHVAEADSVADNLDYIFAILATSDLEGRFETPKVRDGQHVKFTYIQDFQHMRFIEQAGVWDDM